MIRRKISENIEMKRLYVQNTHVKWVGTLANGREDEKMGLMTQTPKLRDADKEDISLKR